MCRICVTSCINNRDNKRYRGHINIARFQSMSGWQNTYVLLMSLWAARTALDNNSIASSAGALLSFRAIYLLRVSRRPRKSVSGNLLKSNFVSKLLTCTGRFCLSKLIGTQSRNCVCSAVIRGLLLLIMLITSFWCMSRIQMQLHPRYFLAKENVWRKCARFPYFLQNYYFAILRMLNYSKLL